MLFFTFVMQQSCALFLPNLMSDIVDIGIRSAGIESVHPEILDENYRRALKLFMSESEKNIFDNSYLRLDAENIEQYKSLIHKNRIAREILYMNSKSNIAPKSYLEGNYILKNLTENEIKVLDKALLTSGTRLAKYMKLKNQNNSTNGNENDAFLNDYIPNTYQIYSTLQDTQNLSNDELTQLDNTEFKDVDIHQILAGLSSQMYSEMGVNVLGIQTRYILKIGLVMILITLISLIFVVIDNYFSAKMSAGISLKLRKDIFEKVQSFSAKEFDEFPVSSLITRTTDDVSSVKTSILTSINFITPPIMFVGGLIMAIRKSFSMSWTILLESFIASVIVVCVFIAIFPKVKMIQELMDRFNLILRQRLSGIMVIRSFGNIKAEENKFDESNKKLSYISEFVNRSIMLMTPFLTVAMNLMNVIIIWLGAKEISNSRMQVGDLMAFTQYSVMVIGAFLMLVIIFSSLPEMAISIDRVLEILSKEPSVKDPPTPQKFGDNFKGEIKFKNVSFGYSDNSKNLVLKDINFTITPGEVVGIIGPTGSGKSSLAGLIPRLYDVSEGEILIDGINVKYVSQYDLRQKISYVSQKPTMFSGDILYNLRYANEGASNQEIETCADISEILDVIKDESGNLNKQISQDGKNLSVGQRQRICIARALLKKSSIYIFDDSFSSLDFKTEAIIRGEILKYLKGSTLIIVSQRLGAVMGSDKIIVMENGQIIGQGDHEGLLEKCEIYRQIVKTQIPQEVHA